MKSMFERHAKRLTPEERNAVWSEVSAPSAEEPRPALRWALPATAALVAVAAGVLSLSLLKQAPMDPGPSERAAIALPLPISELALPGPIAPAREPSPTGRPEMRTATEPDLTLNAGSPGVLTGRVTDSQNRPLPYANVVIKSIKRGVLTGEDGTYRLEGLAPDAYSLEVYALGHEKRVQDGIRIRSDQTAMADIQLNMASGIALEEIVVQADRPLDMRSSTTRQSITAEQLRELPVANLRDAIRSRMEVAAPDAALHIRGGRSSELKYQIDGLEVGPARPPVIPTTGGNRLPNDEPFDSMFFRDYGVNPFIPANEDPLSTFAVDVDAASYTVARRYIELGHLPPPAAVRVEEFVNFFPQGYPRFEREDFRILIDGAPSPFGPGYHLLRIGIKGRDIAETDRKPARLTFVIDVSGSMSREDRLGLVKRSLHLLVDQLRDDDRVGIVVYGSAGRVLLEPTGLGAPVARALAGGRVGKEWEVASDDGRQRILDAIDRLRPEGSTNAEQGLQLGYHMARSMHSPEAINRIVLCSDGVANVGRTGPESILSQVRSEADRGIHLTTIGFGMGNYNDVLMEQLADRGDGNHYYVDGIDEAHRVLVENLTGTLQTIAKDAKVQVEFDSTRVLRYRLLGFENRDVADRDFRNDKVDAGEIGAGHEVTALYEVKLAPRISRGTLATVRFRYAQPEQERAGVPRVREIERRFDTRSLARRLDDASPRFQLDAAAAEFAEILRGSYWAKESKLSDVLPVARRAALSLSDEASTGLVELIEKASTLSERSRNGEGTVGR